MGPGPIQWGFVSTWSRGSVSAAKQTPANRWWFNVDCEIVQCGERPRLRHFQPRSAALKRRLRPRTRAGWTTWQPRTACPWAEIMGRNYVRFQLSLSVNALRRAARLPRSGSDGLAAIASREITPMRAEQVR